MAITRKIQKSPSAKSIDYQKTPNKYIMTANGVHFFDENAAIQLLLSYPAPMIGHNSGIRRYINDPSRGLRKIKDMLDLSIETSTEDLEQFIFKSVSIYLFGEPGKFPVKIEKDKGEETPEEENTEDPDDAPPIDKALNEIGITTNDFKI